MLNLQTDGQLLNIDGLFFEEEKNIIFAYIYRD